MKNIVSSFALAIMLIAATVVMNYFFPANSLEACNMENNNLDVVDEYVNDIEFDKEGNLTCETIYQWDRTSDQKGNIVMRTVVYEHNK